MQACRTVASSSELSREKRGHLLTSTMASAKSVFLAEEWESGLMGEIREVKEGCDEEKGGREEEEEAAMLVKVGSKDQNHPC